VLPPQFSQRVFTLTCIRKKLLQSTGLSGPAKGRRTLVYRFVIGQISHETNVFSPISTGIELFGERGYLKGKELFSTFKGTKTCLGGFMTVGEEVGAELIPTVSGSAVPSGTVTRAAHEELKGLVIDGIKKAGKIDGVLLALHGAMVVDGVPDAEGDILKAVREVVGPSVPVAATLDYHANMTEAMIKYADGLFGYNTYPHIDGWERGVEAAHFVIDLLNKKIRPVTKLKLPAVAPGVVPARTGWGPIKKLFDVAYEYEKMPGVINVSVYGGFVYSDIHESGLAMLATTDNDPALAQKIVDDLAERAWNMRQEFVTPMLSPEAAVKKAMAAQRGPVVLADVADNTGGGASGDGTEVLRALLKLNAQNAVVVTIPDPEATNHAFAVGVGGAFDCMVGGKIDDKHGAPVHVKGRVKLLSDGEYVHRGPMSTGLVAQIGRTAVVVSGGVEIIINEFRFQPLDAEVPRSVGIDPRNKQIVVLKSAVHYRASYEPIAAEIIEVDGPGIASPNLERFTFKHIRRPVFPIDKI
jgi:microcystin degradation protein MlrC